MRYTRYAPTWGLIFDIKPVRSALYRAGPTARKSVAAETGRVITEKVIKTATDKSASPIVFVSRNGRLS